MNNDTDLDSDAGVAEVESVQQNFVLPQVKAVCIQELQHWSVLAADAAVRSGEVATRQAAKVGCACARLPVVDGDPAAGLEVVYMLQP